MERLVDIDGAIYYGEDLSSIYAGKFHREDGPAVEFTNGRSEYWKGGRLHRVDGPAITHAADDKSYCWYLDGVKMNFDEFIKATPISDENKMIVILKY